MRDALLVDQRYILENIMVYLYVQVRQWGKVRDLNKIKKVDNASSESDSRKRDK